MNGLIFNIQRFSIHDGPGIRTTVFLKGCNLNCRWCHNPESQWPQPQIQLFPQNCIHCGHCVTICPVHAHQFVKDEHLFRRELCQACGRCAEVCNAGALVLCGHSITVDEVIEEAAKDEPFYRESGGGITISGGEPLMQPDFVLAVLQRCHERHWSTAVDTAGHVPWQTFAAVLPWTNLFLYDLKSMDRNRHRAATGVDNHLILANLQQLGRQSTTIWIRIPIIPGFNDSVSEMTAMAEMIESLPAVKSIELLPYHGFAENKYTSLGMTYQDGHLQPPADSLLASLREPFLMRGLPIVK